MCSQSALLVLPPASPCELPSKCAFLDPGRNLTLAQDRSENWEHHNQYWSSMFDAAHTHAGTTCDWSVSGAMGAIFKVEWKWEPSRHQNDLEGKAYPLLLVNRVVNVPLRLYVTRTALLMDKLVGVLPADVEVLVETGSGWSRHLQYLVSSALLTPFPRLRLFALEFSEGGRSVCRLFSHLRAGSKHHRDRSPIWPVRCGAFNYLKPDYAPTREVGLTRPASGVALTSAPPTHPPPSTPHARSAPPSRVRSRNLSLIRSTSLPHAGPAASPSGGPTCRTWV